MKKKVGKYLPPLLICIVMLAAVLIGGAYFNFISHRIYEDSTDHLKEIYDQVNHAFGAFIEKNWGILDGWGDYFALAGDIHDSEAADFIAKEQAYWGFSDFYFLSGDTACITLDGTRSEMNLGSIGEILVRDRKPILSGADQISGQDITIFAAPVQPGVYQGFPYDGIAISYTNKDLANSLNVDAFSGQAKCFVIRNDGAVLLSTRLAAMYLKIISPT